MGWGEARKPPPPTRADLARDLAAELGVTIPADVSAEDAWPKLLEYAGWCAGFCVGEGMGTPPWADQPAQETATERRSCPSCGAPQAGPLPAPLR